MSAKKSENLQGTSFLHRGSFRSNVKWFSTRTTRKLINRKKVEPKIRRDENCVIVSTKFRTGNSRGQSYSISVGNSPFVRSTVRSENSIFLWFFSFSRFLSSFCIFEARNSSCSVHHREHVFEIARIRNITGKREKEKREGKSSCLFGSQPKLVHVDSRMVLRTSAS